VKAAGVIETPGGQAEPSSVHAAVARRAVAQLILAKQAGDDAAAARLAKIAAKAVDRHLAARLP